MSIKKILSYFFVVIITMVCFNEGVSALCLVGNNNWPDYNSDTGSELVSYYCSYNMGKLLNYNSMSFDGSYYDNKNIYLMYYKDEIYYIHPGNDAYKAGEERKGGSAWDKCGIDQKVNFDSTKLKKYLVSNGVFSCKELNFYQSDDNLHIVTPEEYQNTNLPEALRTPAYSGSLMYKGENISNKCGEIASQINSVTASYQTEAKNNAINGLNQLASQNIYQLGDAEKAKGYYDSFMTIYNEAFAKFQALNLSTTDNSYTFNIKQCDAVSNEVSSSYNNLKQALENDLSAVHTAIGQIITLNSRTEQNIRNSGNAQLADQIANERSILDDTQAAIIETRRELKSFIDNANLGYLGDKVDTNCEGILGQDLLEYIDKIFTWIKIAVPIIVIVMGSIDFASAVLKDDNDALKKATSRFTRRCIIAILIFFIPSLLSFILHIFNSITSTGGISTCGIG